MTSPVHERRPGATPPRSGLFIEPHALDRLSDLTWRHGCREYASRREGMIHAMDGGLWLHRHVWKGHPMVHLVSTDRERLVAYGAAIGMPPSRLQYKPLKDPRTGQRREAWHWDLVGPMYPPVDSRYAPR